MKYKISLSVVLCCLLSVFGIGALRTGMASAVECPYLYGIHDSDPQPTEYLNHIKAQVSGGWVTSTVAIGHNPADYGGVDFSWYANQGHTVVCRLNNGYSDIGTIPLPAYYNDFATRCRNFVQNSPGCSVWTIGNETNLAYEWPPENGHRAFVTPQSYADCFRAVYNAIKSVHPNDVVISEPLAPFAGPFGSGSIGDGTTHDANPLNWVQYLNQMLTAIKNSGPLDGIGLHINSRGYTYGDIHSTAKVNAGGQDLYWSFYVYKDWIDYGIPTDLYHLPVYATECNGVYYWKGNHPENPGSHYEVNWMDEIYAEINNYNQNVAVPQGKPVFRCVNMYRWCAWCDGWNVDGGDNPYKGQILQDLDDSCAQHYTWPASSPPAGVIDNTNAGFSVISGTWSTGSSSTDKYGSDYRYNTSGTGADVVRWTPSLANSGNYDVYVWYPQGSNRANNAPFVINYNGGSQTVPVNQTINGGTWNFLGSFPFASGSGNIELNDNAEATKAVFADAVKFTWSATQPTNTPTRTPTNTPTYTPVAGIFVDDGDAGYTTSGTWTYTSGAGSAAYNGDYNWIASTTGASTAWAQWTTNLPSRALYDVYVMFRQGTNRAIDAPYTVYYSGGSQTVDVNQQANGGTWVKLGTYVFDAGTSGYVKLSNGPAGASVVIADAVRWLNVGPAPTNTPTRTPTRTPTNTPTRTPTPTPTRSEQIIDDGDATYTKSGTWTYVSAGGTEPLNGDYNWATTVAGASTAWSRWTPNLTGPGNYQVFVRFRKGSNRPIDAPYKIVYNGGNTTVDVNQTINGGTWVSLGTFNFLAGTSGYVQLDNGPAVAAKAAIADAVKFTPN